MKEPNRRPDGSGWRRGNFRFMGVDVWGWKRDAAQRIEARSDETLKAAQPEGQEPDGEAMRPKGGPHVN